jgi:2-hydroxy-6-oxonona-2,4-dienedioate hydrolase
VSTITKSDSDVTYESTYRVVETKDYRIQINEAGQGHPVLLIHGGGPGATGWGNFAPNLPVLSRKYRRIAVTMPGWGESSHGRATTLHVQPAVVDLGAATMTGQRP